MKNIITAFCLLAALILSGCSSLDFQLVEKTDNFKPSHASLDKIIILAPDYFIAEGEGFKSYKNQKTIGIEKTLTHAYRRAAKRFGMHALVPGIDDTISATYFNEVEKLRNEITHCGYIYNFKDFRGKANHPNLEPLSANLILSPEFQNLEQIYGTKYFYHTTVFQHGKDLFFFSVLADLEQGKIVYRELVKMTGAPRKPTLDLIAFNNFNDMLYQK